MNKPETPIEIELKLLMPDAQCRKRVLEIMKDAGYRIEAQKPVKNKDYYLDSFDWILMKNKLAVRMRQAGRKHSFTMKGVMKSEGGVTSRMELEQPVDERPPDPAQIPGGRILDEVRPVLGMRRLLAQILIETRRDQFLVAAPDGTSLQLVFDSSSFLSLGMQSVEKAVGHLELEAEYISGNPEVLSGLGELLASRLGLIPAHFSKLETALQRLGVHTPVLKPPLRLQVQPADRFDVAARKIVEIQWIRFKYFVPGVLNDIDIECIHQARVCTRRMRSALRLSEGSQPAATALFFAQELRWMADLLGNVRDLDVYLSALPDAVERLLNATSDCCAELTRWVQALRKNHFDNLIAELQSKRFQTFSNRLDRFLARTPAQRPSAPKALAPTGEAAPQLILKALRRVKNQGRLAIDNPIHLNFHLLRIKFKQLRYALEFFEPLYGDKIDPFIDLAAGVQDCLGEMQDTVFARSVLVRFFAERNDAISEPYLFVELGRLYQLQEEISREKQRAFFEIWRRFAKRRKQNDLIDVIKQVGPG
jgi:triphosphatase